MKRFVNADSAGLITANPYGLTDKNLFAYCDNNPVGRKDSAGYFFDTVLDIASVATDVVSLVNNPADPIAWVSLAADVMSLLTPGVTGGGTLVRIVSNSDEILDGVKYADKIFDAATSMKSTSKAGKAIHKAYEPVRRGLNTLVDQPLTKWGSRWRPDAVDFTNRVIYELKPFNRNAYKRALRQTKKYADKLGGKWTIVIDMYK